MLQAPNPAATRTFRDFLFAQGYDSTTLTTRIGQAQPPAPGEQQNMFEKSSEITAANVLVRLFLLGATVDAASAKEFIPDAIFDYCRDTGLLEQQDGNVCGSVVIIPVDDLLFASDAFRMLGTVRASEFVLPASTHSANFLRLLTLRNPVATTLDLGCGCGIHALFAARHSDIVIATDISNRALAYTNFNALLNDIDNIECCEGSLFEPVNDRRFDLIITNPPFVISPSESFVYRDNAMVLDEFCELLVTQAPRYLTKGGHLQMLCEWVELAEQSWQQRIGDWIRGCDAWILHPPPMPPAAYVQQRSNDISGDAVDTGSVDAWLAYLEQHAVRAIHPGMLTLRRRDGKNWLHVQNLTADVLTAAGSVIADGIAAVDFLEACDDESLLEATFSLAQDLAAEQLQSGEQITGVYLRLDNALAAEAEVDAPVAAFLNLFSGTRSVRQCISEFGATTDADLPRLSTDLLTIVRMFVSRGFLVPTAMPAAERGES